MDTNTKARLEHLRGEIRAERISYAEIAELQSLADEIDPDDVELLQWAGVPEHPQTYNVFELDDPQAPIGTVQARTDGEALRKAQGTFGGRVAVSVQEGDDE